MAFFSVNQKRTVVIALMAVSLVYGANTFAADASNATDGILATETNSNATADKSSYLKQIYSEIAKFVNTSKQQINSFFDKKNKEPYKVHITKLGEQLEDINNKVIQPLRNELTSKSLIHDEQYHMIVRKTDEIISELYNNLHIIHSALKAQKGNEHMPVINALKAVQQKIGLNLAKIEKNINELYELAIKYDAKHNAGLANDVAKLKAIFDTVKNSDPNFAVVLTGIMHRVKC